MTQLKVAADSPVEKLAKAIERTAHKEGSIEILATGAKAVHRATLAIAKANKFVERYDAHLSCTPYFNNNTKVTSLRYVVGLVKD